MANIAELRAKMAQRGDAGFNPFDRMLAGMGGFQPSVPTGDTGTEAVKQPPPPPVYDTDPMHHEIYKAQRADRGVSNLLFGAGDLVNMGVNAGITDLDYFTGGGLSGGKYNPYQFPMPSQAAANLATNATGAKIIDPATMPPDVRRKGQLAETLISSIPVGPEALAPALKMGMAGVMPLIKGAEEGRAALTEAKAAPLLNRAAPGTEGEKVAAELAAPAVHTGGNQSLIDKIFQHAEQHRSPVYPPATEPVFGPADTELTKQLVPQQSMAGNLPPVPTGELPFKDRARPILDNQQAIADQIAADLTKSPNQPKFYSTGSVLLGLQDRAGLRPQEALDFMGDWAGQGAATSPRTKTPQNLRNSSYLMYRRAQGDPLTSAAREAEGNRPGFAMMGMHTDLADQFAKGTVDPWNNPKPYIFGGNWTGNMADVTGDTHYIRKVLDVYDRLNPGGLPKEWFTSPEAYQSYVANKGFPKEGELPVGDIRDSLGGGIVPGTGKKAQTEYPIITNPARLAAEKMGISPAEVQERMWFEGGPRTGLRSPAVPIPGLLNSQIEATAKATGLSPDAILKLWARRGIPLASNEPDTNMPGASAVG